MIFSQPPAAATVRNSSLLSNLSPLLHRFGRQALLFETFGQSFSVTHPSNRK
ncbi:hypothetical protein AN958_01111 [Leucoagaricus sp. SymC.cos]|nr:hypothetical protein AN958_01111 [Leucoagaricus sp. SymC.cos]